MFFFFSKTIGFLTTPLAWILISVTFAFMTNKSGRRKKRNLFAFLLLLLFTNPWLANKAIGLWEYRPTNIGNENYDLVVILSGMTIPDLSFEDRVQFTDAAERFIEPLRLYHQEKVRKILISGGSGSLLDPELKETPTLQRLAIQLKVAEEDLVIETESRNTHENAKFTAAIIRERFENPRILLVTSAGHMKRSEACFEKQGIDVTPYPVDFKTDPNQIRFLKDSVPSVEALKVWTSLFHELFGFLAYWVAGYV